MNELPTVNATTKTNVPFKTCIFEKTIKRTSRREIRMFGEIELFIIVYYLFYGLSAKRI